MKTTASTAEFEATLDHRWISQLGVLDVRLRAAGFRISPDRWLNIADLLTDLMLQNGINKDEHYFLNVKQYLSPLICKSAIEQQEFSRVFSGWWEDIYEPEIGLVEEPEGVDAERKIVNRVSNATLAFGFLMLLLGAFVAASVYFDWFNPKPIPSDCLVVPAPSYCFNDSSPDVEPDSDVEPDTDVEPDSDVQLDADVQPSQEVQVIRPRLETDVPPILSLSDANLALMQLILVSFLPLFLVLILLLAAFRPMLSKGKADPDNPLRFLTLSLAKDDLFDDPKLRSAIRSLHAPISLPTTRLHPKRTVYASLQQGGLFSPVYAKRAEVPEVMVWVNNKGKLDPIQAFTDTLVARLRAADLRVIVYSYRKRPNRLLDRATNKWASGSDIQALHQGARLIIVTSSLGLIDVWNQKVLPWLSNVGKQFDTVILEPGAHHSVNGKILASIGIELCPLSSEGIRQVCARFSQTSQTIGGQRLAVLPQFLDQEERWRSPVSPNKKDLNKLLLILKSYLGESGFSLLCASAVYPEFRWGLIRALDLSLFTQDTAIQRETRLLALAQLSWARDGWLPEWLRLSLVRSQSKSQHDTVRMLYQQLLVEVEINGEENVQLPVRIHKPKSSLRSYLRQWIKRSKQNSDLEDSVFVNLMLGGRFRRLDFELPRALEKFFRVSNTMRHMISTLSLLGLAVLFTWGNNTLANNFSLQPKLQQFWTTYIAKDEAFIVHIYTNQKSLQLSEQLQKLTEERGSSVELFNMSIDQDPYVDDMAQDERMLKGNFEELVEYELNAEIINLEEENHGKPIDGLIVYRTGYKTKARWLADRVSYASYGLNTKAVNVSEFPEFTIGNADLALWLPKGVIQNLLLKGHTESLESARFSFDGKKVVTASRDTTARVWSAINGQELLILEGHTNKIDFATFSPDDQRIVTVSRGGTARLWDASSGETIYQLEGHTGRVDYAAFSPNGRLILTTSRDRTVKVWDTSNGKLVSTLSGHRGDVRYAAFSPEGRRIVSVSYDRTARVWDAVDGKLLHTLDGNNNDLDNATNRLTAKTSKITTTKNGHYDNVNFAAFSPNGGLIATASRDHTTKIWDANTGNLIKTLQGHSDDIRYVSFSPDGERILTASRDTTAKLWNTESGELIYNLTGHTRDIMRATFSPDGSKVATASDDRTARVWDATNGKVDAILGGHEGDVIDVSFSPNGNEIVTASDDNTARIWNIQAEIDKQANSVVSVQPKAQCPAGAVPAQLTIKMQSNGVKYSNYCYYLANGSESCKQTCAKQNQQSCNVAGIEFAAQSMDNCKAIVGKLVDQNGLRNAKWGQYPDDTSGCTFGDWGSVDKRWIQIMKKDGLAPSCDTINPDVNRMRVCACD